MYGASASNIRMQYLIITGYGCFDHLTPAVQDELHWLPVKQRMLCKVTLFVFKSLYDCSLDYKRNFFVPLYLLWGLHHACASFYGQGATFQHRLRTHIGQRSFPVFSARGLEQTVPAFIRDYSLRLDRFKIALKAHLFSTAYM